MSIDNRTITVALVGNPNCGKTTLSNSLTGSRDTVGNYPRVTINQKSREISHKGRTIRLVDLPGVYSLTSKSSHERVGRDFIQSEQPDIVLNILDAGNLARSLFLTTHLIEMGRPRIYVLNMIDEARAKGIVVDTKQLRTMLGGPIVETNAVSGEGLESLLDAIVDTAQKTDEHAPITIPYDNHLEEAIKRVQALTAQLHPHAMTESQSRWLAIKLLEGDDEILTREGDHDHLTELVRRERYDFARQHGEDCEAMFSGSRYGFVHGLMSEAVTVPENPARRLDRTRRLDAVLLHRALGLPIFLGLMWLAFETTFTLGTYPMDWIDAGVGWLSEGVAGIMPEGLVRDLVVDGILAGVGGTIIFLPNIIILFFFMALFSETGYLARSAFLLDRVMHMFGLHGKAFIPLVMGFGCNVPAIMACRTIESPRARLIAVLINPFMCCTARLPVFVLFAAAFFSAHAGTVVFAMYIGSMVVALFAAILLSKFVIRGADESFVMELPPFRIPTLLTVLFHMWENAVGFLQKVAGVILVGSIILWFLQAFPQQTEWSVDYDQEIATLEAQPESKETQQAIARVEDQRESERLRNSYLARIGLAVTPVFEPIGFGWKDTVAILTGLVAKEVVVASYAVLYSQGEDATEESEGLRAALASSMTPAVALAFMVFVLLYCPCLSTIAVLRREAGGWRWAGFSVAFSMSLAWILAFSVATIGQLVA